MADQGARRCLALSEARQLSPASQAAISSSTAEPKMSTTSKDRVFKPKKAKAQPLASKVDSRTFLVQGNRSFKAIPIFISSGAYEGHILFMRDPMATETLNLCRLPVEIRIMILKMVLDRGRHYSLRRIHSLNPSRVGQTSFYDAFDHRHLKKNSKDRWIGMPPSSAAILRVSKDMLAEAAPIAYGENTFCFADIGTLSLFLADIGSMRVHLKNICLVQLHRVSRDLAKELEHLDKLRDLRSLTFRLGPAVLDKIVVIKIFAWLLKPLLQSSLVSGRGGNILDIIQVQGPHCHYEEGIDLRSDKAKATETRKIDAIVPQIRAEVAKALKIKVC